MIPSDWEVTTIGDFCKVYDGTHQTPNYVDFGIPFYSVENVSADDFEHTKYISLKEYTQISKRANIVKGDILMTRIGSIGVCKYVDWNCKAGFYVSLALLKCNDSVDARFICHLSNSENFKREIELHSLLTAIPQKINLGPISNVRIALPKKLEQQRIANALSEVDALIANLEKLIAKKKNIKQGAMQQLLTGKKRLPGFSKPWIDKKLGEGLKFQCGAPFQSTYFNREHQGVRLIKNRDLKSDDQIYYYDGEYTYDYIVKNGNLLVGMDGDFMPCLWNKGTALLNQRVGRILTNCWSLPYLYYILIKPLLEKQDGTGATTVKHLSHRDVENMVVYMTTDIQEQTAIANVLSDMDTEIATLETKLAKYRTLKIGMMQQLLTGKIRLV